MIEMTHDTALFSDRQKEEFLEGWKNAGGCTKTLNESSKLLCHPWEYSPLIMTPKKSSPYDLGWDYWEKTRKDVKNKSIALRQAKEKMKKSPAKMKKFSVIWPFGVLVKIEQWAEKENLPFAAYTRKIFLDAMSVPTSLINLIRATTVPINQGILCDKRDLNLPHDELSKFRQYVEDNSQFSNGEIMRLIYIEWLDRKEASNM